MYRKLVYFTLSMLLLLTGICPGWAGAPPNPTKSDSNRNTAGGTEVLINNKGIFNTGFGYRVLYNNKTGEANTANGLSALEKNTIGSFNMANGYQALMNNTTGSYNTAIGNLSLNNNTTGFQNTATGSDALFSNTTGSYNTANGIISLHRNTTGQSNSAFGYSALFANTVGSWNTAIGGGALYFNTKGNDNAASGAGALYSNTTGSNNTANGINSLHSNTVGMGNSAFGRLSLSNLIQGNENLALGLEAGSVLKKGSKNLYISNSGDFSESSTIRIGSSHTRTFIAGIRARKTGAANAVPVVIDSNGQLGTINSSARFKKDIKDMADASHKLLQLRPVTYRYKEADDNGSNPIEYGLIAEDVAQVYPDLVAYGADGKIETVQYHKLTPMLLNELQRTNRLLQADDLKIQQLTQEIANLKKQRLEVAYIKQQVTSLQTQVKKFELLSSRLNRIEAQQLVGINR